MLGYEFFIAKRYLKSRRKTGFISLITYISIAGVMVGVAALIIVLSVFNGLESEVRSRFINIETHLRLSAFNDEGVEDYASLMQQLKNIQHIVGMMPFILDKGLIRSEQGTEGLYIKGINPDLVDDVTEIRKNVIYGELNPGMARSSDGRELPGIVLGFNLADKLYTNLGDVVTVISPAGFSGIGRGIGLWKQYVVTGYFKTDLYEFDDIYAFLSLESAQELYQMDSKVTGLEFRLEDRNYAHEVAKMLEERFHGKYRIQTWFDFRRNLYHWMHIEKIAAFIILSLIITVAAFNIISTLIMVVLEKTRDVGILKSMGATAASIRQVFVYEGVVVGVIGTILGSISGYSLCWSQIHFKWFSLPSDIYIITALPVLLKWSDFVFVNIVALVLCVGATVYPAMVAARLNPVESINYE